MSLEVLKKTQFVKDLQDRDSVANPFLVKSSAVAIGKTGKPYITLVLMDKTGEVDGRIWDEVTRFANHMAKDAFVFVEGKCQLYQGRKQVVVKEIRVLREDEIQPDEFIPQSKVNPEKCYQEVLKFIDSMQDPYYKALAEAVLKDDSEIVARMKLAPAARSVHHAYRSGLIEHVVSIVKILEYFATHYQPYVDRDLLFLGGFFHDICKIWELSYEVTTDYTDEGRLIGHLVMGVELVDRKIRELESQPGRLPGKFPEEKKLLVKHVILAHHGQLEYGSPKRPKCLEALIVHYVDDLDSKVNAIQKFISEDPSPGRWTAFNRQHDRFFYKPDWAIEKPSEHRDL